MQWKKKGDHIVILAEDGEDLIDSIKLAFKESGVLSAVIISSIGQVENAELGFFVERGDYSPSSFKGPMELLGISGMISRVDGEPFPHFHAWISDRKKNVVGGHLIKADVKVTNETILQKMDIEICRKYNNETGLMHLSM